MPYGGTTPEQDKKIESCVNQILANPGFKAREGEDRKSAAIAICKARIMKSEKNEEFTKEQEKIFKGGMK